jgi:magnesium-transporting ATPase (P-type)
MDKDLAVLAEINPILAKLRQFQYQVLKSVSESKSIFQMNPFSNKFLVAATMIVISLQLLVIYNPVMQKLMKTTELSFFEWALIIPVAASIVLIGEIRKLIYRRKKHA